MRQQQREAGLIPSATPTPSNRKSRFESPEEESAARQDAVSGLILIMRQMLPVLLRRLVKIPEPRNPNKLKHRITVLMLYGILIFEFQYAYRRAANGEITRPMFEHNPRLLFPKLESLRHSDTLFRLLCRIDVGQIEQAHIDLVNRLIRNKKFSRYLINNCFPLAIDGSQKIAFSTLCDEHLLQRKSTRKTDIDADEQPDYQYYFYVLEASLSLRNQCRRTNRSEKANIWSVHQRPSCHVVKSASRWDSRGQQHAKIRALPASDIRRPSPAEQVNVYKRVGLRQSKRNRKGWDIRCSSACKLSQGPLSVLRMNSMVA